MLANRREFLSVTSAMFATSATAPLLLQQMARAAAAAPSTNDNVLVVVQLSGGNDGLNTVVPFADDNYRRLRPTIHLADAKLHRLDDHVGLHPALEGWKKMFDEGLAAVVQSVGYPHPNRSHFESMNIWQTVPGDDQLRQGRDGLAGGGWLARAIDQRATAAEQAAAIQALRIGDGQIPAAVLGCRVPVPSLSDVADLQQRAGLLDRDAQQLQAAAWRDAAGANENPLLRVAAKGSLAVHATAKQVESLTVGADTKSDYPDSKLAEELRLVASLLRAGFSSSIYYVEHGGFDTHISQLNAHENRLEQAGAAIQAFVADVRRSAANRPVLVLVFSEFGRRAAENASGGTDHGTAAPVYLFGNGVRGGVHGPYPDLANLVDDDPVFAIDFRRVYATVLEQWMGVSSQPVLGGIYEVLDILARA